MGRPTPSCCFAFDFLFLFFLIKIKQKKSFLPHKNSERSPACTLLYTYYILHPSLMDRQQWTGRKEKPNWPNYILLKEYPYMARLQSSLMSIGIHHHMVEMNWQSVTQSRLSHFTFLILHLFYLTMTHESCKKKRKQTVGWLYYRVGIEPTGKQHITTTSIVISFQIQCGCSTCVVTL